MRRLWVIVAGLLGLVVGFLVGARLRLWPPWEADWAEAAGTWVSAGLSAAILVWLAVRSEKQAKGLEAARQARDEEETLRREQAETDGVVCDTYPTDSHLEDGMIVTKVVMVVVDNHTEGVLRRLTCDVPFGGIGSVALADAVAPGEGPIRRQLNASEPIRLSADGHELRERVVFTFSLNGVSWSRRPADTEAVREELTAAQ